MAQPEDIYRDLKHVAVSVFNGTENAAAWLELFDTRVALYQIPNARALPLLKALLTGRALQWYNTLPAATQAAYLLLREAFRREFVTGSAFSQMTKKAALYQSKQAIGESVGEFLTRLQSQAAVVEAQEEHIYMLFLSGLRPEIQERVSLPLQSNPNPTLRVAREMAEAAETMLQPRPGVMFNTIQSTPSALDILVQELKKLNTTVENQQVQLSALASRPTGPPPGFPRGPQPPRFPTDRPFRCFKCNGLWHRARDCMMPAGASGPTPPAQEQLGSAPPQTTNSLNY